MADQKTGERMPGTGQPGRQTGGEGGHGGQGGGQSGRQGGMGGGGGQGSTPKGTPSGERRRKPGFGESQGRDEEVGE